VRAFGDRSGIILNLTNSDMKKYILCCLAILCTAITMRAQESNDAYTQRVRNYVRQYYPLAIMEQKSTGIPASITLGQGILETDAGASDLMTLANNHFGIKCTRNWTGETITHDDETADECFKKYKCAADSYRDHSDHLKTNPRYKSLFVISPTDYASWAIGLKKCGYATNPQYAQSLIKIIDDFKLQEYTYYAMENSANYPTAKDVTTTVYDGEPATLAPQSVEDTTPLIKIADSARYFIKQQPQQRIQPDTTPKTIIPVAAVPDATTPLYTDSDNITLVNGLKAFHVRKDEMILPYAVKYHQRYARLLELNDLPDGPAPFDMYIYLEKKLTFGAHEVHKMQPGETLLMVAQEESMQLKKIMAFNLLEPNEEPVPGTILELQKIALQKPQVTRTALVAHTDNAIVSGTMGDPRPTDDYITINRAKPGTAAPPAPVAPIPASRPRAAQKRTPVEQEIWLTEQKAHNDSLAALKAELDKEVYADDAKTTPHGQNKQQAKYTMTDSRDKKPQPGDFVTVRRGQTAFAIAAKNHITVDQLLKWNHLHAGDIEAGQKLRVTDPGGEEKPIGKKHAPEKGAKPRYYIVRRGDNLGAIAHKNKITIKQLKAWNRHLDNEDLQKGQKLRVSE